MLEFWKKSISLFLMIGFFNSFFKKTVIISILLLYLEVLVKTLKL